MRRALASLPRTVWLLGAISLVNDAASDMHYQRIYGVRPEEMLGKSVREARGEDAYRAC